MATRQSSDGLIRSTSGGGSSSHSSSQLTDVVPNAEEVLLRQVLLLRKQVARTSSSQRRLEGSLRSQEEELGVKRVESEEGSESQSARWSLAHLLGGGGLGGVRSTKERTSASRHRVVRDESRSPATHLASLEAPPESVASSATSTIGERAGDNELSTLLASMAASARRRKELRLTAATSRVPGMPATEHLDYAHIVPPPPESPSRALATRFDEDDTAVVTPKMSNSRSNGPQAQTPAASPPSATATSSGNARHSIDEDTSDEEELVKGHRSVSTNLPTNRPPTTTAAAAGAVQPNTIQAPKDYSDLATQPSFSAIESAAAAASPGILVGRTLSGPTMTMAAMRPTVSVASSAPVSTPGKVASPPPKQEEATVHADIITPGGHIRSMSAAEDVAFEALGGTPRGLGALPQPSRSHSRGISSVTVDTAYSSAIPGQRPQQHQLRNSVAAGNQQDLTSLSGNWIDYRKERRDDRGYGEVGDRATEPRRAPANNNRLEVARKLKEIDSMIESERGSKIGNTSRATSPSLLGTYSRTFTQLSAAQEPVRPFTSHQSRPSEPNHRWSPSHTNTRSHSSMGRTASALANNDYFQSIATSLLHVPRRESSRGSEVPHSAQTSVYRSPSPLQHQDTSHYHHPVSRAPPIPVPAPQVAPPHAAPPAFYRSDEAIGSGTEVCADEAFLPVDDRSPRRARASGDLGASRNHTTYQHYVQSANTVPTYDSLPAPHRSTNVAQPNPYAAALQHMEGALAQQATQVAMLSQRVHGISKEDDRKAAEVDAMIAAESASKARLVQSYERALVDKEGLINSLKSEVQQLHQSQSIATTPLKGKAEGLRASPHHQQAVAKYSNNQSEGEWPVPADEVSDEEDTTVVVVPIGKAGSSAQKPARQAQIIEPRTALSPTPPIISSPTNLSVPSSPTKGILKRPAEHVTDNKSDAALAEHIAEAVRKGVEMALSKSQGTATNTNAATVESSYKNVGTSTQDARPLQALIPLDRSNVSIANGEPLINFGGNDQAPAWHHYPHLGGGAGFSVSPSDRRNEDSPYRRLLPTYQQIPNGGLVASPLLPPDQLYTRHFDAAAAGLNTTNLDSKRGDSQHRTISQTAGSRYLHEIGGHHDGLDANRGPYAVPEYHYTTPHKTSLLLSSGYSPSPIAVPESPDTLASPQDIYAQELATQKALLQQLAKRHRMREAEAAGEVAKVNDSLRQMNDPRSVRGRDDMTGYVAHAVPFANVPYSHITVPSHYDMQQQLQDARQASQQGPAEPYQPLLNALQPQPHPSSNLFNTGLPTSVVRDQQAAYLRPASPRDLSTVKMPLPYLVVPPQNAYQTAKDSVPLRERLAKSPDLATGRVPSPYSAVVPMRYASPLQSQGQNQQRQSVPQGSSPAPRPRTTTLPSRIVSDYSEYTSASRMREQDLMSRLEYDLL